VEAFDRNGSKSEMPGGWTRRAFLRCGCGLEMGLIVAIVPHVIHGAVITFLESFAEVLASFSLDWGVFVHFMIIGIGMAMFAEIMSCSFHALVKTALLCVAIISRGLIPAVLIVVLVLCRTGSRWCFMRAGFNCAG